MDNVSDFLKFRRKRMKETFNERRAAQRIVEAR